MFFDVAIDQLVDRRRGANRVLIADRVRAIGDRDKQLACLLTGLIDSEHTMPAKDHETLALGRVAKAQDVGFHAGGMHAEAEARQLCIPYRDHLCARLRVIDEAFREVRHGWFRVLYRRRRSTPFFMCKASIERRAHLKVRKALLAGALEEASFAAARGQRALGKWTDIWTARTDIFLKV